jgi:hypothetical protein
LQQENCFQLNEIDEEHYCERLQQGNCFQLNEIDEEHYCERLQQVRSRLVAKIIESNVQSILIYPLALYLNLFVVYAQLHKFLDVIIDVSSQELIGLNYWQVLFPHCVNLILLIKNQTIKLVVTVIINSLVIIRARWLGKKAFFFGILKNKNEKFLFK